MGILKNILKSLKSKSFTPDFSKTEYENWLAFLECGGTSEQWEQLKNENVWVFIVDEVEIFEKYQKEINYYQSNYYELLDKIEKDWSVLYNLKDYRGSLARQLESYCLDNIEYFQKMYEIDFKYGKKTIANAPAFKRLAMLYEKQGKFEEAISICKAACFYGIDERSRMLRLIKKAGRTPTAKEYQIIEHLRKEGTA